jgi:hypothetical protein
LELVGPGATTPFRHMNILQQCRSLAWQIGSLTTGMTRLLRAAERMREAIGRIEARQLKTLAAGDLRASEFRVYSQWGEDGIIQHLLRHVPIRNKTFVEFGVEDYTEANTRFLLVNDNWSGLVLDGSEANVRAIRGSELYWRYNLKAVPAFVTRENINDLLSAQGATGEIGLLSIDVDGVDYWIWEAIHVITPALVIAEYNARFGPERAVTVPYDPKFHRGQAHCSSIYYGASLAALVRLGRRKGYAFVGANSAGNNAFFVRRDLLSPAIPEITSAQGYMPCKFRETRDAQGKLQFLSEEEETAILSTLPLVEVEP